MSNTHGGSSGGVARGGHGASSRLWPGSAVLLIVAIGLAAVLLSVAVYQSMSGASAQIIKLA